jgi:hypothetical protein
MRTGCGGWAAPFVGVSRGTTAVVFLTVRDVLCGAGASDKKANTERMVLEATCRIDLPRSWASGFFEVAQLVASTAENLGAVGLAQEVFGTGLIPCPI